MSTDVEQLVTAAEGELLVEILVLVLVEGW